MQTQVMAEYIFRDMSNGEFWIDVKIDRQPYCSLGPYQTEGERQRVHDDLMSMTRSLGAKDLPAYPQQPVTGNETPMVTEAEIRRGIDRLIAEGRAVHAIVDGKPGIKLVPKCPISEYDGLGKCSLCGTAHSPTKACPGTEGLTCMFCGDPVGGDFVTDDNEGIACPECAAAEIAAQKSEGLR